MRMYHGTEFWGKIQEEGVLWGRRGTASRCTYLTPSRRIASRYGSTVLQVEFDPETDIPNNWFDECWQCRVYAPIPLSRVRKTWRVPYSLLPLLKFFKLEC